MSWSERHIPFSQPHDSLQHEAGRSTSMCFAPLFNLKDFANLHPFEADVFPITLLSLSSMHRKPLHALLFPYYTRC